MALANTKPIPEDLVSHCPGQHSQNPEGEPGLARDQQTSVYFPVPQTIASYRGVTRSPPISPLPIRDVNASAQLCGTPGTPD